MTAFAHPLANPALVVAALGAAMSGWIGLSLAMSRHWQNMHGRGTEPTARHVRVLRCAGAAGLLVANPICLFVWDGAQGWIAWLGILTFMALAAATVLSYAPRRSNIFAVSCALVAGVALACGTALHTL